MSELRIIPNRPLTVAFQDPEGVYDFTRDQGHYQTTTGQELTLPRPAVVLINELEAKAGQPLTITQHWSGRPGDPKRWTVTLAESANPAAQEPASVPEPAPMPARSTPAPRTAPTPIRAAEQPRLFDTRGTGTYGPAPRPVFGQPAPARGQRPEQIPANVAVREILAFIEADPNTANWSAEARQDLASTIYIGTAKQGLIGLWERGK